MARPKPHDDKADDFMSIFETAFNSVAPHFDIMERTQLAYDNQINTFQWPTISEIALPLTFAAVEEQLPFAMKYLFPSRNPVRLIPVDQIIDPEVIKSVQRSLWHTVMSDMELERNILTSVKDCYKFGVGYGMIDTQVVTPPRAVSAFATVDGETVGQTRQLALGPPQTQIIYKYIAPCCVVPVMDGAEPDGPRRSSGHFVIELMQEQAFRDMFKNDKANILKNKEHIDEMVEEARSLQFHPDMIAPDIIAKLSGIDMNKTNDQSKSVPVVIPVIKGFFQHEHIWMANGMDTIYHRTDSIQTLRSDLIKLSAWPDGMNWFSMNPVQASERVALGVNVWYNAMVDLAQYYMNPTRVINKNSLEVGDSDVPRGPGADIKVRGPANEAVNYLRSPDFPQNLFTMGDQLSSFYGTAMGQPDFINQGNAGLVRGGANALETLLQRSTGRQLLASIVLKLGGFKDIFEKVLLKKQLLISDAGERWIDPAVDDATGEETFNEYTVTLEDMRNVFKVELRLPNIKLNSAADQAERGAKFDRAQQNLEIYDEVELHRSMWGNDDEFESVLLPKNVREKNQADMTAARIANAQAGATQGTGPGAPFNEGEASLAGAAQGV